MENRVTYVGAFIVPKNPDTLINGDGDLYDYLYEMNFRSMLNDDLNVLIPTESKFALIDDSCTHDGFVILSFSNLEPYGELLESEYKHIISKLEKKLNDTFTVVTGMVSYIESI